MLKRWCNLQRHDLKGHDLPQPDLSNPDLLRPDPLRPEAPRNSGIAPPAVAARVFYAQVAQLYRLLPASLLYSVISSLIVCWFLRDDTATELLIGWFLAGLLVCSARLWLYRAFQRASDAQHEVRAWSRRFLFGVFVAGTYWGFAMVVLLPRSNPEIEYLTIAVLGVIPGVAYASMSAIRAVYMAFVLPFIGLSAFWALFIQDDGNTSIGVAGAIYVAVMWRLGRRGERDAIESFSQRFTNDDLLVELQRARLRAEVAGAGLRVLHLNAIHSQRS